MYDRTIDGRELEFGVSGMLWNANVLLYDRQSESLWSQVKGGAVTGPMSGARFRTRPSTVTSWKKWRTRHPETLVLSRDTGYRRDYSEDPYDDYYARRGAGIWRLFKPGLNEEEKELVAGLEVNGQARAWPMKALREKGTLTDTVAGQTLTLSMDKETGQLTGETAEGQDLHPTVLYWFVWKGAHPETERWE